VFDLPRSPDPSAPALARYSAALGARAFARGPRREAAWRIWMPLDVDRVHELPWVGRRMVAAAPRRILDIASPKLLACWLADRTSSEIVATDLWQAEVANWRALTAAADPAGARWRRLRLEAADATALPYEAGSFDAAYSASVIEHIPGHGDTTAMAELARVLRPGGVLALTFPFRPEHEDEYVEHDLYGTRYTGTPLFFQRHYSVASVEERLLTGDAFEVVERGLWRKAGVREAQGALHRVVPARLELGRFLGPGLAVLGARALTDAPIEEPGPDNVLRLLLRRR
jgi:SAM-dependent methyltransferase